MIEEMKFVRKYNRMMRPEGYRWLSVLFVFASLHFNLTDALAQHIQFSDKGQSNDGDSIGNVLKDKYGKKGNAKTDSVSQKFREKYLNGKQTYSDSIGEVWKKKSQVQSDKFDSLRQKSSKYDFSKYPKYLNKDSIYLRNNPKTARYNHLYRRADKFQKKHNPDSIVNKYGALKNQYGNLKLDSATVFNNKFMKKYTDSIRKAMPTPPSSPFQKVTKDQMVNEVNKKFLHSGDSMADSSSNLAQMKKRKAWADLNYQRLEQADAQQLQPLVTEFVKKEFLPKLDSIKFIDMKAARLKMEEKETKAKTKLAEIRQKETLWNKSYFEGVVGLSPSGSGIQFSPAMAYHIVPSWSVGAGPNILFNKVNDDWKFDVNVRLLTKYEIFERTAYFQAEDLVNPNTIGLENNVFTQHNLMAGGGYVLPFLTPISFNLSLMYRFYSNGETAKTPSNWLFRIGISTNKKPK
jgi:hypothetical protein